MTNLDDRYSDVLDGTHDSDLERLVAELDSIQIGSPTPRGDMMTRHALAVHARELAQTGTRRPAARLLPSSAGTMRQRRWIPRLPARMSVAVAASFVALLSVGTYLHGQSPTPVSAQSVLRRAATASPGANEASHATYRVSSSDGSSGTADVWIGYDGNATPNELALNLTLAQAGQGRTSLNANLVVGGSGLTQVYSAPIGAQKPIPAPQTTGSGSSTAERKVGPDPSQAPPTVISSAAYAPAIAMKGIVVGSLLAQQLSKQPNAYSLQQKTLDGVSVYAFQPTGVNRGITYYFNAQTYVLQGADWTQEGKSWQARLTSYSTEPLSAVPANTFGTGGKPGQPGDTQRVVTGGGQHVHIIKGTGQRVLRVDRRGLASVIPQP